MRKTSGVNLIAACILPLILSFPCMKATWKLSCKNINGIVIQKWEGDVTITLFSFLDGSISVLKIDIPRCRFFRFCSAISKWKIALNFLTASASLVARRGFLLSKRTTVLNDSLINDKYLKYSDIYTAAYKFLS